MNEQAKAAFVAEYQNWKHENSLYILEQYDRARTFIGDDKMAPLETFSQVFFSELVMIQKGNQIRKKLEAKLQELKNKKQITITE